MPAGTLKTKRWDDPAEPDDGFRLLICRYRPRGLRKEFETWDDWWTEVAPSAELLAGFHGKRGVSISWPIYRRRYLAEMRDPAARARIAELAGKLRAGETVTLLCSSDCTLESRCHRSLLRELLEAELGRPAANDPGDR